MTYTETLASLVIFFFFFTACGQMGTPLLKIVHEAKLAEYKRKNLMFIEQSFRNACTHKPADLSGWRYAVSTVSSLEKIKTSLRYERGTVRVYQADIVFNGKSITILAESE